MAEAVAVAGPGDRDGGADGRHELPAARTAAAVVRNLENRGRELVTSRENPGLADALDVTCEQDANGAVAQGEDERSIVRRGAEAFEEPTRPQDDHLGRGTRAFARTEPPSRDPCGDDGASECTGRFAARLVRPEPRLRHRGPLDDRTKAAVVIEIGMRDGDRPQSPDTEPSKGRHDHNLADVEGVMTSPIDEERCVAGLDEDRIPLPNVEKDDTEAIRHGPPPARQRPGGTRPQEARDRERRDRQPERCAAPAPVTGENEAPCRDPGKDGRGAWSTHLHGSQRKPGDPDDHQARQFDECTGHPEQDQREGHRYHEEQRTDEPEKQRQCPDERDDQQVGDDAEERDRSEVRSHEWGRAERGRDRDEERREPRRPDPMEPWRVAVFTLG